MKTYFFIFISFLMIVKLNAQASYPEINNLISSGEFSKATDKIKSLLNTELSQKDKIFLTDKIEIMRRIKLDFKRTEEDVKNLLTKYYPNLTDNDLRKWEKEKTLEMMVIDGSRRYFNNAVPNFFRMKKSEQKVKEKIDGPAVNKLDKFLESELPLVTTKLKEKSGSREINYKIHYKMTLKPDVVPDGEVVRCWMPFPRGDVRRQSRVKLLSINGENPIFSGDKFAHSTVYIEKKTKKGEPTVFEMELQFTCISEFNFLSKEKVKDYDIESDVYREFTKEQGPHILFTEEIKKLSEKIIGDEKNPYLKLKKIAEWIDANIPWTSAREYSTLENIPMYCISNMRGDCGIKSLLLITLCRSVGIPARWQSGWMLHPGSVNLHDWSEVYFKGIGWVPVDPDFGIQEFGDDDVRYFYTNGIDSYRMYVNNDIDKPLFPAKTFLRSETYDFQRGELEWRGGNLYFDTWNYDMEVEYLFK